MKGLQLHSEDLHEGIKNEANSTTVFDAMEEEEQGIVVGDHKQIWLEDRGQEDLLDVNDASIFYGDFPPLPDFPCMSSSSSSSSTQAPVKPMTSSSSSSSASSASSAASWAVLKSDAEEDIEKRNFYRHHNHRHHDNDDQNDQHDNTVVLDTSTAAAMSSTGSLEGVAPQPTDHQPIGGVECMDVMENFGYMDLLESNDFFDPACIFHTDDRSLLEEFQIEQQQQQPQEKQPHEEMAPSKNDDRETTQQGGGNRSDDLAMVFLEWLKSNKESVSADDLRRVKLKKSTIECAAKRLGGGKEGMKQLLKLILEWVQTNHLQRRRIESSSSNNINLPYQYHQQEPLQNPNPNLNCNSIQLPDHQSNPCFNQSPWNIAPSHFVSDPATTTPGFPSMVGYMGDPLSNGASNIKALPNYPNPADYNQMLDSSPSWPPSSQFSLASQYTSFADANNLQLGQPQPSALTGYGNQYLYQYLTGHGDNRLVRLGSSATKEARKKRMARQRRFLSHHRNHHNNQNPNQSAVDSHARMGNDNCAPTGQANNSGNWVYWPTPDGAGSASATTGLPMDAQVVDRSAVQTQNYQRQAATDRRQGWKPEKNLRFLLQKVLKQSDVGNLGRIVLPKKEAETHLPELEARDGISIAMEDIGTSRVWNMRYRFWPNNKSRMYLLENTGDFVRTNGLQEGDFIVIYSDVKCGKYLIRGVKVRQPGPKSENKRAGKSQRNSHGNCPAADNNGSTSSTAINEAQTRTLK